MSWFKKIAQIEAKSLPSQIWYHGTDSLTAYSFLQDMMLRPRSETGETSYEGSLSSLPASVYLTNTPGKAAKHAIERSEKVKDSNPVILVIRPESLGYVHVDEDFVHMMLNGQTYFGGEWYPSPLLEKEIFDQAYDYFNLFDDDETRSTKSLVLEYVQEKQQNWGIEDVEDEYLKEEGIVPDVSGLYEYDETMHAAKSITAALNDKHQKEAIMNFQSLAHEGQVKASEIYLVPKQIERKMDDGTIWLDFATSLKSYEDLKQHARQIDPKQLLMPFMTTSKSRNWFKKIAQRIYDPDFPEEEVMLEEQLPVVTPENVHEFEPGEEETTEVPPGVETFIEEIPERYFTEDERSLIDEAIRIGQCVYFQYTSRKGRFSTRVAEPYGTFHAIGTGNDILVTFDRTVSGHGIRAFIIDNIHSGTLKIMPGDFYHFTPDKFVFRPY